MGGPFVQRLTLLSTCIHLLAALHSNLTLLAPASLLLGAIVLGYFGVHEFSTARAMWEDEEAHLKQNRQKGKSQRASIRKRGGSSVLDVAHEEASMYPGVQEKLILEITRAQYARTHFALAALALNLWVNASFFQSSRSLDLGSLIRSTS